MKDETMFDQKTTQLTLAFDRQPDVAPVTITKPSMVAHVDASRIVTEFRSGTSQAVLAEIHGIAPEDLSRLLLASMAASDEQAEAAIVRLGIEAGTVASDEVAQ